MQLGSWQLGAWQLGHPYLATWQLGSSGGSFGGSSGGIRGILWKNPPGGSSGGILRGGLLGINPRINTRIPIQKYSLLVGRRRRATRHQAVASRHVLASLAASACLGKSWRRRLGPACLGVGPPPGDPPGGSPRGFLGVPGGSLGVPEGSWGFLGGFLPVFRRFYIRKHTQNPPKTDPKSSHFFIGGHLGTLPQFGCPVRERRK